MWGVAWMWVDALGKQWGDLLPVLLFELVEHSRSTAELRLQPKFGQSASVELLHVVLNQALRDDTFLYLPSGCRIR